MIGTIHRNLLLLCRFLTRRACWERKLEARRAVVAADLMHNVTHRSRMRLDHAIDELAQSDVIFH